MREPLTRVAPLLSLAGAGLLACSSSSTGAGGFGGGGASSGPASGGGGSAATSSSTAGPGGSNGGGGGGSIPGDAKGTAATPAAKVLGGFGVNIHTTCCSDVYSDTDALAKDIDYLWATSGVRPILRDSPLGQSAILTTWPKLAQKTGARFDAYIAELPPSGYQADLDLMRQLPRSIVLAYEGPNEPDSAYFNGICTDGQAQCLQAAAAFMPTVHAAGQADGVPVFQTSFGRNYPDPGDYGTTGDLSADASFGNAHTYFQTGHGSRAPSEGGVFNSGTIDWLNRDALLTTPGKPIAITEFGYFVSGGADAVTPHAQGVYTMEVLFDAFLLGNPYYFHYALYDDGSGAWGFFDDDHTRREAADDLHALFTILGDAGADAATFAATKLDFTLAGLPGGANPGMGGKSVLLQKSDGTFDLVVWNEQNINAGEAAPGNVTLTFGSAKMKSVDVYDPTTGTTAIQHLADVKSAEIALPTHPLVLEIVHP